MMGALLAVLVVLGARTGLAAAQPSIVEWPARLPRFLAAAVLVACIEELWFRGALHSAIERLGGVRAAVFAVAALYSAVHFIGADKSPAAAELGIGSGFVVLGDAFHHFTRPETLDAAAALLAAGLFLGVVRHRRGGVAACIGLHAGWVLLIKVGREVTVPEPDARWAWLVSGYDGVIGWGAGALFSLLALLCWYRAPRSRPDA